MSAVQNTQADCLRIPSPEEVLKRRSTLTVAEEVELAVAAVVKFIDDKWVPGRGLNVPVSELSANVVAGV